MSSFFKPKPPPPPPPVYPPLPPGYPQPVAPGYQPVTPVYRPPVAPLPQPVAPLQPAAPVYRPPLPPVPTTPPVPPGPPKQSWTAMFTFGIIAWLIFAFLCIIFAVVYEKQHDSTISCSSVPETCGQSSYHAMCDPSN